MTNNEILTLRMNILGGIDTYIREVIGDDNTTDFWNAVGIPDEVDEGMLKKIAEDDIEWSRICYTFGGLL